MKVKVIRTAMIGGGLSYDVEVPVTEVPNWRDTEHTRICRGSFKDEDCLFSYVDATLPAEHNAMPKGWERYSAFLAHERRARQEMLAIVKSVFPEACAIQGDTLPLLWTCNLTDIETSAEVSTEVSR